jgi:hypothetical protein
MSTKGEKKGKPGSGSTRRVSTGKKAVGTASGEGRGRPSGIGQGFSVLGQGEMGVSEGPVDAGAEIARLLGRATKAIATPRDRGASPPALPVPIASFTI